MPTLYYSIKYPKGAYQLYYNGDNPKGFVQEIKAKLGFDPSGRGKSQRWKDSYEFMCPPEYLVQIRGKYPIRVNQPPIPSGVEVPKEFLEGQSKEQLIEELDRDNKRIIKHGSSLLSIKDDGSFDAELEIGMKLGSCNCSRIKRLIGTVIDPNTLNQEQIRKAMFV